MHNALLYEDTPEDLQRVIDFARRRLELIAGTGSTSAATTTETNMSTTAPPSPTGSLAKLIWDNVSDGQRSQEVLRTLPGDDTQGMTPTELGEQMTPDENGHLLSKGSVRASILNLRRVEKRLREEGRIKGRLVQAEWSDADGANRYHLRPEDHAVIAAL